MKTLYETTVINTGGRQGIVQSPDNVFMLDVAAPPELGGKVTTATNPEQLFAAGYSACFNSALEFQLKKHQVEIERSTVAATVMLVTDPEDNGVKLQVELEVKILGLDEETAQKFVKLAHDYCPYSKGIKGNVNVTVGLA
ncbi:organic hydroperoxide resistance protein [Paenibacillus pabuli]|uniref:organic hydroperoxide resistance protein n=1 Tax=Paenibacillus pabuli TaxID=1472 RepID=UPI000781A4D5|nr:organic hydroperoxide resistance protein [Paenibacillus pabuli]MEC0124044.1 organic hydroperoxide resistance protein [Paenibacillus pabuli]